MDGFVIVTVLGCLHIFFILMVNAAIERAIIVTRKQKYLYLTVSALLPIYGAAFSFYRLKLSRFEKTPLGTVDNVKTYEYHKDQGGEND